MKLCRMPGQPPGEERGGDHIVWSSTVRRSTFVLAGLLAAVPVAPVAARAATTQITVGPQDDTFVSSARKNSTYGNHGALVVGTLNKDVRTAYLKFVVPAGTKVTGARLTLTATRKMTGKVTVSRVVDNSWTEGKLTSGAAPALGLPLATFTPKASDTRAVFDLSAEIAGPGTYSFALRSPAAAGTTRFRSAEATADRPQLAITTGRAAQAVPTPTTKPTASVPAPATSTPAPAPATSTPAPSAPASSAPAGNCVTSALLVPTCGVLWGAAAGGFSSVPRDQELKTWEKLSGRTATIFHTYHKGDEKFPTASEIAMTRDPAHPRVLLLNWRVEYGSTWAKVAAGKLDARIDAFAARVKSTYPQKFFLVLNHEPEDDVNPAAGSGMTAKDFAASYRHVTLRLRAKGVTNAISVVAYMGNEKWMAQSWWKDLYPGDDVVDWVGIDSYVSAEPGYYHHGMFADLLDRKAPTGPGFYDWAVTQHPTKPVMVAEWGAYHRVGRVFDKSAQFASVLPELAKRPAVKAIVYFDTKQDAFGDRDISINSAGSSLAAFRKLAANPIFNVKVK
jgi:beta-mannanase